MIWGMADLRVSWKRAATDCQIHKHTQQLLTIVRQFPQCISGRSAVIAITVLEHASDLGNAGLEGIIEDSCD